MAGTVLEKQDSAIGNGLHFPNRWHGMTLFGRKGTPCASHLVEWWNTIFFYMIGLKVVGAITDALLWQMKMHRSA